MIVARDFVPTWHWTEGEPLRDPLSQMHGRVAHLGVIRAPVEDEGDGRWNEFIVLRDEPIPINLGCLRSFLNPLVSIDSDHHDAFNAPASPFSGHDDRGTVHHRPRDARSEEVVLNR